MEHDTLVFPTEPFVYLVEKWETIFKNSVDNVIHMNGILGRLFRYAKDTCLNFSCSEETCKYKLQAMLKLYMKVRLHAAIKKLNKTIRKSSSGKKKGNSLNCKICNLSHVIMYTVM